MSMTTGGKKGGAMNDINMTPMIDVLLVLLVIFMIIIFMIIINSVLVKRPEMGRPWD